MDQVLATALVYLLLAPLGVLISAVFWIWVISEGVTKGLAKHEQNKNKKEK